MCVLALAWSMHPRWRLIVAANRDEFHARAAAPLSRWDDRAILAGRDLVAGGTWLAVSADGGFAAVTNLRGFGTPDATRDSRGALVVGLADGSIAAEEVRAAQHNPFNAIAIRQGRATFVANRPTMAIAPLAPGLHAISNGPLDPPWRKTMRLSAVIRDWLATGNTAFDALFAGLRDPAPPGSSADDPAAIFIDDPVYGTRCSTVVAVTNDGAGTIAERRYDAAGNVTGTTALPFQWPQDEAG